MQVQEQQYHIWLGLCPGKETAPSMDSALAAPWASVSAGWAAVVEVLCDVARQSTETEFMYDSGQCFRMGVPILSLQETTPSGSQRFIGTDTPVNLGKGDIGFFQRHTSKPRYSPCPPDMVQGSCFNIRRSPQSSLSSSIGRPTDMGSTGTSVHLILLP